MSRFAHSFSIRAAAVIVLAALPLSAADAHGGDREPAGGVFMSSYVTSPYATARAPEARPLDRPTPGFVPEATGSVRAVPARHRMRR